MLVSVIVATYNCAPYIEDALNSVFRQTHNELELVVTDDCSNDDSVAVATRWIEAHRDRFVSVSQTQTVRNSGVTANYNTGLDMAHGVWIKCLDGDDILTDNAIETYLAHCLETNACTVWYAHEQAINNGGQRGDINRDRKSVV